MCDTALEEKAFAAAEEVQGSESASAGEVAAEEPGKASVEGEEGNS